MQSEKALLPTARTINNRMSKKRILRWISYVPYTFSAILVSIMAIIISCIGMFRTNDVSTKTMIFPIENVNKEVALGDIVSIDSNGHLKEGAGTTVYRNIETIENKTMYHLHTASIGETIHIAQYDSEMRVTVINPLDDAVLASETFVIPIFNGTTHRVDDITVIQGNVVLSLGANHCIACRVIYRNGIIDVTWGDYKVMHSFAGTIQPEMMPLNDSCVIVSYFGIDLRITAIAGCLIGSTLNTQWGPYYEYSEDYIFHDIIGLSSSKFIVVHARWPWWKAENEDDIIKRQTHAAAYATSDDQYIHYALGTVHPDLSISVAPVVNLTGLTSFGFMDMAKQVIHKWVHHRLDDTTAVLSFIYEGNNNGLRSLLFKYNPKNDHLSVASYYDHQKGAGTSTIGGLYSFIRVRSFSPTRFGLYYSDFAVEGTTALSICEVTPSHGIIPYGPEFIVSPSAYDSDRTYYWTNLAAVTEERFFIMESLTVKGGKMDYPHAAIHVGEVYPSPLGIVIERSVNHVTVAVDGIVKRREKLTFGKMYAGNSNGKLIEADYVGSHNIDSHSIYMKNEKEQQILSSESIIGYAISENELFLRTADNIEVENM